MFEFSDSIWAKQVAKGMLKLTQKGPPKVVFSTPTVAKVAGITPRIYHTQIKRVKATDTATKWIVYDLWTHWNQGFIGPWVFPLPAPLLPLESCVLQYGYEYRAMVQSPLPSGLDGKLRSSDTGKALANVTTDQHPIFHLDHYLLLSTLSVWLYEEKESYGNLSFEIGIQSLWFYASRVVGALVASNKGNFHCKTTGVVKLRFPENFLLNNSDLGETGKPGEPDSMPQGGILGIQLTTPSQKSARTVGYT